MKVTLLGTSGGLPIPGRAQSGVLVEALEKKILLDCGMGIPLRLSEAGIKVEDIDLICLTHGHLDHIQDLPSLTKASWLRSGKAEYKIITPSSLRKKLISFWQSLDEYERTELQFEALGDEEDYESDINIRAFETKHTRISQGYEISIEEKKLVYTGDTATSEKVMEKAEGADLLIHELSHLEKRDFHTDPEGLIAEVKGRDVGEIVITHFYPPVAEDIREIAAKIQEETGVPTTAGEDLQEFSI
ncbi:MAG: MBL fold metallo-hydrolase [Candidatus Thermoplasmatota archaeon]|nr:MBL fold metallo-hydrolase [Candidatus Thermoplasmatota archaeon]